MMMFNRDRQFKKSVMAPAAAMARMDDSVQEVVVTGSRVQQEQLGDLKLYRIPDRTTVAARQSKQVRLMDRERIPVSTVYAFESPLMMMRGMCNRRIACCAPKTPSPTIWGCHCLPAASMSMGNGTAAPCCNTNPSSRTWRSTKRSKSTWEPSPMSRSGRGRVRLADTAHAKQVPWLPGIKLRSVNGAIWVMSRSATPCRIRSISNCSNISTKGRPWCAPIVRSAARTGVHVPPESAAQGSITVHYQLAETEDQAVRSP